MLRKSIITLAAAVSLGAAMLVSNAASAEPYGMHAREFHGFAYGDRDHDRDRDRFEFRRGFRAYGFGNGCMQGRRVWTPYGWTRRRVWVCG